MFSKIVSFFISIWMFICSLLGINTKAPEKPEFIEYSNDLKTVTISIDENPTTGYSWVYTISDSSIIRNDRDEFISSAAGKQIITGAGGTRVLEFSAIKEGSAILEMKYERSWEQEPVKIITVKFTVSSDLTISCELISDISK